MVEKWSILQKWQEVHKKRQHWPALVWNIQKIYISIDVDVWDLGRRPKSQTLDHTIWCSPRIWVGTPKNGYLLHPYLWLGIWDFKMLPVPGFQAFCADCFRDNAFCITFFLVVLLDKGCYPQKSLFPPQIRQNWLPAWQNQNLLHGSNLLYLFLRLSKFADLEADPSSKRVLLRIKFWSMDQIWVLGALQYCIFIQPVSISDLFIQWQHSSVTQSTIASQPLMKSHEILINSRIGLNAIVLQYCVG